MFAVKIYNAFFFFISLVLILTQYDINVLYLHIFPNLSISCFYQCNFISCLLLQFTWNSKNVCTSFHVCLPDLKIFKSCLWHTWHHPLLFLSCFYTQFWLTSYSIFWSLSRRGRPVWGFPLTATPGFRRGWKGKGHVNGGVGLNVCHHRRLREVVTSTEVAWDWLVIHGVSNTKVCIGWKGLKILCNSFYSNRSCWKNIVTWVENCRWRGRERGRQRARK